MTKATFAIQNGDNQPFTLTLKKNRTRWALKQLMDAGRKGCTPINNPAPRWSAYIHLLREMGALIETNHEQHGGPYAGTHGRYVLKSNVTFVEGGTRDAA